MKAKNNFGKTLTEAKYVMLASIFIVSTIACTKQRDADMKDLELKAEIFEIQSLQGKQFDISTDSSADASSTDSKTKSINVSDEKPSVKISNTSAPEGLQKIFKGLLIKANASETLNVKLSLKLKSGEGSALHVLKLVTDEKSLTQIEKQTLIKEGKDVKMVPLFKVAVADYGQLCRVKNENGDETTNITLCHTDMASATHVRISVIKNVRSTYLASDALKEVFVASSLNGLVTTMEDLVGKLNVSLSPVDGSKVVTYVSPGQGSKTDILIYKIMKRSDIKNDALLKTLDSNVKVGQIAYCSQKVLEQLSADEQKDCVIVLSNTITAEAVVAEVKTTDELSEDSLDIAFKPADASKNPQLLKITAKTAVNTYLVSDINGLNPYNTIRVEDIRDKEFLLRRTFEDGAASIQVYGPGASGELDIVKFELEDRRLVVRRATVTNGMVNPDKIDREELMSIPVRYLGIDPNSNKLNPNLTDVNKDTAQFILLNWTNNSLPAVNSPLVYFQDGQCFHGVGDQTVTDLDNRIKDGVLNFSISGSYAFQPECMSWYGLSDYWYGGGIQSSFNIKERVSFKLHTQDLDNKAVDLPFRAQNLMNFGVFTAGKIKPDDFGNNGNIGTQEAHAVIHDFSGGKQMTYSLGGLPENGWVRDQLISGTKEVIKEWNDGLRLAFKGTPLERQEDFILLKIDGIDQEAGRLGDLDRNYIWNFNKNLDSGLLGMSQAGPNPRSGRIEQNNILMYSGNLLSNIGSVKEIARLQKEYQDMRAKALDAGIALLATKVEQKSTPVTADAQSPGPGSAAASTLISQMNILSKTQRPQTPISINAGNSERLKNNAGGLISSLRAKFQGKSQEVGDSFAKKADIANKLNNTAYLQSIFQKAIAMDTTRDESAMNALSAAEILKSYGNRLSNDQKLALSAQSRRLALMAEFEKNFRKGPNCAIIASNAAVAGFEQDPELLDDSKLASVFKSWYKSTLLHEMGHSLGLTHNFMGSTDKANFAFKSDSAEEKDRNYSSIMDYIPDQYLKYHGPGVYDIRALRVAYTGLIEVDPSLAKYIDGDQLSDTATNVKIKLQQKSKNTQFENEVSLADLKTALLGDQSWWKLDASMLAKLPLKKYRYCTDVHVGGDPACNRWDLGTDNEQIAKFYIQQSRDMYPVLNSLGNRINARSFSNYIARIFNNFFSIRTMMDETFYLAITGQPQSAWLPSAYGAINGLYFFGEIVNTPSVAKPYSSLERFQVYKQAAVDDKGMPVLDGDGNVKYKAVLVESKSNADIYTPGMPDQVDTRGVEYEKAIALMMLAQRGTGNPRYENLSLRFSYADFEKYILGAESSGSLTLQTLRSILADNQMGIVADDEGAPVVLPEQFQPEITQIVKYYGGLSAGVLLDADSLEDKYNFSALFRTGSSQRSTPKDRVAVTKLDQSMSSQTSLKLWALDNASISEGLIRKAAIQRVLIDNSEALVNVILKFTKVTTQDEAKAVAQELGDLLLKLNKNDVLFGKDVPDLKLRVTEAAEFMLGSVQKNDALAVKLEPDFSSGKITEDMLPQILDQDAKVMAVKSKDIPYLGIAQKALLKLYAADSKDPTEVAKSKILAAYVKGDALETNYGIVISNLSFLNKILFMTYPELNNFN